MAAFLSSFILFLGLLLSMSGFSMDIFIDWVKYPQTQQSVVFTATKDMSVINVALACGFASPSHFSKCYRAHYDTTPYRERGSHAAKRAV